MLTDQFTNIFTELIPKCLKSCNGQEKLGDFLRAGDLNNCYRGCSIEKPNSISEEMCKEQCRESWKISEDTRFLMEEVVADFEKEISLLNRCKNECRGNFSTIRDLSKCMTSCSEKVNNNQLLCSYKCDQNYIDGKNLCNREGKLSLDCSEKEFLKDMSYCKSYCFSPPENIGDSFYSLAESVSVM